MGPATSVRGIARQLGAGRLRWVLVVEGLLPERFNTIDDQAARILDPLVTFGSALNGP